MRKWIPQFWHSPVKRHRIAVISGLILIISVCWLSYIDIRSHIYTSMILAGLIIIFSLLTFILYTFGQLKEIWQDIFSFLKASERNAVYDYYQAKHKDKKTEYKGPDWEDEEFKKISDLKKRVDTFVKTSIDYQQVDFKRWEKRNVSINLDSRSQTIFRSFWILCATAISILFLTYLGWFEYLSANNLKNLSDTSRGFFTIPVALLGTAVAAPIIFIVWLFRDKNNRIQIENGRKDTNLKDFQKLSEWASGFHLPEVKQTTSTKTSKNGQESDKETTTSQEDFIAHEGSNSISRRLGAEALQASAIAQLEAFMFGKYGEQFMQPAFLLIHAIWESIITQHQNRLSDEQEFKNSLPHLHKNPTIAALNRALIGASGNHLRLFNSQLLRLNLTGIYGGLFTWTSLNLSNCDLSEINLTSADLSQAAFINTKLPLAVLNYANLSHSKLQCADLTWAHLRGADLYEANLQKAEMGGANLQNCDLSNSNLELTNLRYADLRGANLCLANFKGAKLKNIKINRNTLFGHDHYGRANEEKIREDVLSRGAIWDDDPKWLVGKIQDKDLLEKIFQDYEKRQNDDLPF